MRAPGWLLAVLALGLMGAGWRVDGAGRSEGRDPAAVDPQTVWSTELGAPSYAPPVVWDGRVYVTVEPTTLVALDAASGAVRWRHEHPWWAAQPVADRPEARRLFESLPELRRRRDEAQRAYAAGLRGLRAGDPAVTSEVLAALAAEADRLRAQVDAVGVHATPPRPEPPGYASATPWVDADGVVATFANGVVVARDHAGAVQWVRAEPPGPHDKVGFGGADTASPVVQGSLLVVAHADVVGLDRSTGEERWRVSGYRHFGTPAVVDVAGNPAVVLSDGRVIDGRSGAVTGDPLATVAFSSPHPDGPSVYLAGSERGQAAAGDNTVTALALSWGPDGVRVARRWQTVLDDAGRFFTTPVTHAVWVFAVSNRGRVHVLDRTTGTVQRVVDLQGLTGEVMAGPLIVGRSLWVFDDLGHVARLALDGSFQQRPRLQGPQTRAAPWPVDDGVVWWGEGSVRRVRWPHP